MFFQYQMGFDGRWKASQTIGSDVLGTVTSNGACMGISLWWIIKRSLGDDFWKWFGPPKSASRDTSAENGNAGEPMDFIKEVMNAQGHLLGPEPDGNFNATVSDIYKMNLDAATNYIAAKNDKLRKNEGVVDLGKPIPWGRLAEAATLKPGFALINFWKVRWGGHAVAAHILHDGRIEWMDPNIGEVDMASRDALKRWVETDVGKVYNFAALDEAIIQPLNELYPPAPKKLHEM
jgi:hypothetical protein